MRVRHIKSGNLVYGSYPRFFGATRFDVLSRTRLRDILDGREKYAKHVMDARGDQVYAKRDLLEEWQKVLWVLNTAEDNTSAYLHVRLLTAYIKECGYERVDGEELTLGEAVDAHVDAIDYYEIPDISEGRMKAIEDQIHGGMATAEDKQQFLKAFFNKKLVPTAASVDSTIIQGMFKSFATNQLDISQRIKNHISEVRPEAMAPLELIFQNNDAQKIATIKEICGMLKIDTAFNLGQQIQRSVMEQQCGKVVEMKKELQKTFNLRVQEKGNARGSLKRGLELINSVLHTHGFTEIGEEGPRKRATVAGKRVDTGNYVVKEQGGYSGFVKHSILNKVNSHPSV